MRGIFTRTRAKFPDRLRSERVGRLRGRVRLAGAGRGAGAGASRRARPSGTFPAPRRDRSVPHRRAGAARRAPRSRSGPACRTCTGSPARWSIPRARVPYRSCSRSTISAHRVLRPPRSNSVWLSTWASVRAIRASVWCSSTRTRRDPQASRRSSRWNTRWRSQPASGSRRQRPATRSPGSTGPSGPGPRERFAGCRRVARARESPQRGVRGRISAGSRRVKRRDARTRALPKTCRAPYDPGVNLPPVPARPRPSGERAGGKRLRSRADLPATRRDHGTHQFGYMPP